MAGCSGGGDADDARVPGRTLTVYASLPRHGDSAREADAVAAGQRLALADAGGRVGRYRVRLVELDSSDLDGDGWDPDEVKANASRAADDPTTIGYLGELDSGGSAISVPITNEEGILQVSPADGLTSLTRVQPGGFRTTPDRYYPGGRRTFMRLVPNDLDQAATLIDWIREEGGGSVSIVHDDRIFGRTVAVQAAAVASRRRLRMTGLREVRPSSDGYAEEAEQLEKLTPEAVLFVGREGPLAAQLLTAVERALPNAALFAASGLATGGAGEPSGAGAVRVVTPNRPRSTYPAAGRRVLARLDAAHGTRMPVDALYGYESMDVLLDAVRRAGTRAGERAAVARLALAPGRRAGVIGGYRLEATGDVSERRFAAYRRRDGRLEYDRLRAPSP